MSIAHAFAVVPLPEANVPVPTLCTRFQSSAAKRCSAPLIAVGPRRIVRWLGYSTQNDKE
jgi:hypothetical protein